MLSQWDKFKGWTILEFFLRQPTARVHIKGLARALKISPLTATTYLNAYSDDGVLERVKVANASVHRLDNERALVRLLKQAYIVSLVSRHLLPADETVSSIALFGSCASGDYDEKSDIDLLVVMPGKHIDTSRLVRESPLEVNAVPMTVGEWLDKKKRRTEFAEGILTNHILIYGNPL